MERVFRINPKRPRYIDLVIVLLCGAPLLMLALGAYHWEMWRGGLSFGSALAVTVILVVSFWADRVHAESATLTVGAHGMRMESDLPKWLGPSAGWSLAFDEIGRVGVVERFALVQFRKKGLSLAPVPVRIMDWIEDAPGAKVPASARDFRQSELWKALEKAGVFDKDADRHAEAVNFDLAKHPATRAALAVMAVLAAYWAFDSLVATEAWAEWGARYLLPPAVVGVVAAVVAGYLLKRPQVPMQVAMMLAVLLGVTSSLASWVGMVRVNQVLGGPLEEQAYVRNDNCDTLLPKKEGLPPIEYTELARGYWCQFPKDVQHKVPVRQGLFGLYQVDLRTHTEAIREYRGRGGQ